MTARKPPPQDEIREGRSAPSYTDIQDWVGLANISPQAHSLYVKLRMHVNATRGDNRAWPGKERLAMMMGVARGDYIDKWLDEITAIGAVEVVKEGMPRRNVYIVHALPPPGYEGPTTLKEWATMFDAAAKLRRDAAKEKTRLQRERAKAKRQVKPVTGESRVQAPVTGPGRVHVTDSDREHVTGDSRVELEVDELEEFEPSPPTPRRSPPTPSAAGEGGGGDSSEDSKDPVGALVDELHGLRPRWAKAAIRRVLDEETANGRPFPLLAEAARACAADMSTRAPGRIREGGPWWDQAANVVHGKAAPARPPWCGECESSTRRLVYIDGDLDRPARCPRCGPAARSLSEAYA